MGEEYISETSGTMGERFKEYLKEPSPIQAHNQSTATNSAKITSRCRQGGPGPYKVN